ncbi:MAG: hypothetical protein LQ342_007453 [Letrouitia transgressa]|nr:MAG: hypothetical protein LQ342_007453 [Letrouitia transgressa]
MGVFPGWWLGEEDGRLEQPTVSPEKWAEELRSTGFDGLETVVYDHEHPYQVMATMVARPARELCIQKSVTLLHRSTEANLVVQNVKSIFTDAGYFVTLTNLSHEPVVGQDVISLLDLEGPFFDNISAEDFAAFKAFVSKLGSMRILYVTGSCQVWCKDPRYAAVLGLARTLRSELSVSFATCEMDNLTIEPGQDIFRVFCKFQLSEEASNVGPETEFAVSNGKIHIGRMHWLTLGQQYPESTQNKPDTKKRLDIVTPGVLQSLEWQSAETTDLTGEQVEVEMRAVGVNFKDVLIAMGYVPAKAGSLGVEGSGIVRRVSPEVRDLKPGDRVMVLEAGAFTTMLRTRARVCVKMLDDMSFEAAATIPSVFGTVIWSLIDTKHLQKDETVLIHSACGGVGLAAMEICQMIGATVYATVGTEEKAQYLMQRYGLPRNRIFYSRDTSFLPDLMRETNGRGVDAVLNSLSGELLHASWQCVAEFGMMLEIGKRDFLGRGKLNMDLFEQNRSFIGVDCAQICNERPDIVQNMLARSVKWYGQGLIRPIEPMTCFPATKVEECFRYMQKGQHIGKIVITMPKNLEDLHLASINPKISLRPDKAYLLVGGLGGLGKAVSVWLVEHGARHLIYLGRSAGRSDSDKRFIAELALMGCSAQWFQGSVAIMEDVQNAVKKASKPIAGVLQMSMVLRDQAWRQMTHESWQAVHSPKVTGTWNLHNALLDYPLDFFVLFSSYSGIVGQWGQANYASSNTFLNSFTQYRHSLGLPASCLDIGAIEDIGFVSENPIILDQFRATGNPLLGENDLLDVLQLAIVRSPAPSKLIDEGDFCNPNQILQGLKSTLPLSDPNNRTIWKHDPRMSIYRNLETASSAPATSTNEALKHFLSATSQDPALLAQESSLGFLAREIGARLQDLLLRSSEDLDLDANLSGMGVDSLVSIEIKNWWKRNLGLEITVLEILSAGTVRNLASVAVKGLKEKYGGADAVAGGTEKEETGTVNMQTDGERKEEFMHMKAA